MAQPIRNLKAWLLARAAATAVRRTGSEDSLMNALSGWKVYITAAATVIGALAGVATGELDFAQALHVIEAAGIFASLRHALNTTAGTTITTWLTGLKTYIVALASILAAVAGMATGVVGLVDGLQAIVVALLGIFGRKAITKLGKTMVPAQ